MALGAKIFQKKGEREGPKQEFGPSRFAAGSTLRSNIRNPRLLIKAFTTKIAKVHEVSTQIAYFVLSLLRGSRCPSW